MARHGGSGRSRPLAESAALQAGRRVAVVVLAGSVTGFAALLVWPPAAPLVRDLVLYNLAYLAAAYLCWWPRVDTSCARRAWRLLGVALLLATAGNVGTTLVPGLAIAGEVTLGDVLDLSYYPVLYVAALLIVRDPRRPVVAAVWLDGLVVGLSAAAVVSAFVVTPLLRVVPPASAQAVVGLATPLADLTLLIVVVAVGGVARYDRRVVLLGVGLGLELVTDLAHFLLGWAGRYHEGHPLDLGWLLVLVPVAAAACLRPPARPSLTAVRGVPVERTAIATPTAAGLAALAVLMGGYHIAVPLVSGLLAGACILVVLLRAALTLHELRALPEARREARTDPLTELANRRHLLEWSARLLARPDAAPVSMLMIDLDGFKAVNDHHGHAAGDALLVEVATRLAAVMRRDDLLGRLGGDEFAAVLPRTPAAQAAMVAQRIHGALGPPIGVAGQAFRVDVSVGISTAEWPARPATLFEHADSAMYRAKRSRTGTATALPGRPLTDHRDDLARRRA